jgi:hypothetical protein
MRVFAFAMLKLSLMTACAAMLGGCMAAALAPLGLQALGTLGVSAGDAIAGRNYETDDDPRGAGCEQLSRAVPYIAEVRTEPDGSATFRQWAARLVKGEPRWTVIRTAASEGDAWQKEAGIGWLNFTPALQSAVESTKSRYVITAPADPASQLEAEQLLSLTLVFGPRDGTYDWRGKRYEYAVAKKLPCLPGAS